MSDDIHIVALSARTAVGLTAESTAAAIRAGVSRVREHTYLIDGAGERLRAGYDHELDPALPGAGRVKWLAQRALQELLGKVMTRPQPRLAVQLLLALPEVRPGFTAQDAAALGWQLSGPPWADIARWNVRACGEGHAGGLVALQEAMVLIRGRHCGLCLVGGVDSYLDANTVDWLDGDRRIARTGTIDGFFPGEGVSMIALADDATRAALELPTLARLRAVRATYEHRRADSDEGLLGEALTEAIEGVAASLRRPNERFDDVYCDINGERERTDDYGFALLRTSSYFRDGTAYIGSAVQCGDLGAASAILNCVLATRAWQRGYASGPRALVWGASWSGTRGAALLETGGQLCRALR